MEVSDEADEEQFDLVFWQESLLEFERQNTNYEDLEELWQSAMESVQSETDIVAVSTTYAYLTFRYLRKEGNFIYNFIKNKGIKTPPKKLDFNKKR